MIWFTTDIEMKVKEISGLKGYTAFTYFYQGGTTRSEHVHAAIKVKPKDGNDLILWNGRWSKIEIIIRTFETIYSDEHNPQRSAL